MWTPALLASAVPVAAIAQVQPAEAPPPSQAQQVAWQEEVRRRLVLACSLAAEGQHELAGVEYEWVWTQTSNSDPVQAERNSFWAEDIRRSVDASPEVRNRFTSLRDATGVKMVQGAVTDSELLDWVILNNILGDKRLTLEWFNRVRQGPPWVDRSRLLTSQLERLLQKEGRWSEMAFLYVDPIAEVQSAWEMVESLADPAMQREGRDNQVGRAVTYFQRKAALRYAACLAAGRGREAAALALATVKLCDAPETRLALVEYAHMAGQVQAEHLEWLDAAVRMNPEGPVLVKINQLQESIKAERVEDPDR